MSATLAVGKAQDLLRVDALVPEVVDDGLHLLRCRKALDVDLVARLVGLHHQLAEQVEAVPLP